MRRKSVRFRSRVLRKMHCYPAAVADTVAHAHTAASPIQHGAVRPCLQQRRGTLLADGLSFKQQPPRTNISRITAASGRLPCSQQQLPWTSGCGALLAAPPAATPPAASHQGLTLTSHAVPGGPEAAVRCGARAGPGGRSPAARRQMEQCGEHPRSFSAVLGHPRSARTAVHPVHLTLECIRCGSHEDRGPLHILKHSFSSTRIVTQIPSNSLL